LDQYLGVQIATCTRTPETPSGRTGRVVHLFEEEKNKIYILTVVDRATHCLLSWDAVSEKAQLIYKHA